MADEDEKGTGADDDAGKPDGDGVIVPDGKGDGEDLSTVISIEGAPEDEEGGEKPPEKKPEKKGDGLNKKTEPTLEDLKREHADLLRKNKDLNKALHEERTRKKAEKGDDKADDVLTDAQLLGILEEYKDDAKTQLNVIRYAAEQAAKKASKGAISDADVVRKKKETEEFVHKNYPDLLKEDSQLRTAVDRAKDELGIGDHPYAELFGTAVTFLAAAPQALKDAYEQGKKDAMAGVGENKRKEKVEGADLTPNGGEKKKSAAPSKDETDVLSRLGLKSKRQIEIYKKMTSGGSKSARTVTVEG